MTLLACLPGASATGSPAHAPPCGLLPQSCSLPLPALRSPGAIAKVIELHVEMPPADVVEMYAAMCRFTHAVYSEQQDKGDQVGRAAGWPG